MTDSNNTPALRFEGVTKTFRTRKPETRALQDVSFAVREGDFFGLLGPNGAGKSTLIGILAGLVNMDAGKIALLGLDSARDWRAFKMAIGIVPQEITFDPHFTVWETLHLQSGYYGLRDNDAWLEELLKRLGLSDKKDASVHFLSGGMKRRVLIAQALVHRPPVIVLDEPTAGVDIELRHRLWDFMRELNRKGHTIILTTHYLEEAEELCKTVALLNHGKLVALDSTENLLRDFSGGRVKFRLKGALPAGFPFECTEIDGHLYSAKAEGDDIRCLLNALHSAGLEPENLEIGRAGLEEVFLRLTAS
jgi:ABC-2 type transport system ATP-binding protein